MRTSTSKQEYGLDSQLDIVQKWIVGKGEVISYHQEQISGKVDNRPALQRAIDLCKKEGATLLITKLDRLSRNVAFLFQLKDSGVDIACCDLPDLNTLTLGIFATMAQHERELISKRTKEGLAVARKKGRVGGAKKGCDTTKAVKASLAVRKVKAESRNKNAVSIAKTLRAGGMILQGIADKMQEAGFTSSRGLNITIKGVQRWINA